MYFCKVCNSRKIDTFTVKEKQYAILDEFKYLHCLECGSLMIKDIPNNLSKYYPTDYYSFAETKLINTPLTIKKWLRSKYWQYIISKEQKNIVGYLINLFRKPENDMLADIISKTDIYPKSKVIDIGCGNGDLLKRFYQVGYWNILGLDPNINHDIYYEEKKLVLKAKVENYAKEEEKLYDLIMFHHSFEHMPNPEEILETIKRISHKETRYLIRIPLSNSYAFEKYRENWSGLDAPRHLFIYSEQGMRIMLENHNFEILEIIYDSTEYQFWASEQYMQNISLVEERSYWIDKSKSIFSEQDILNFRKKAKKLNQEKKGDTAAFIFKLKSSTPEV